MTGGEGDPLGIVQKFKFDLTVRWYMLKPESILENEMHKIKFPGILRYKQIT